jgi:hypothetical protein
LISSHLAGSSSTTVGVESEIAERRSSSLMGTEGGVKVVESRESLPYGEVFCMLQGTLFFFTLLSRNHISLFLLPFC